MRVHLIVAMAQNRVIGADGGLPWHLSADLKRFKRLTMGHPIVMGRKTWESLPRRPLPGRENVVVTHQKAYQAEGATVVHGLNEALERARQTGASDAFVIGGGQLFEEALPLADVLDLTLLHHPFPGDTFFPELDEEAWREVDRESHEQPAKGGQPAFAYEYVTCVRA